LPPDVIILRLKCTKFDFGWGSAPDPLGERCELPKTPLAGKKGKARKGREERKKRERGEGRRDIPPHPLAEA